MQGTWQNLNSSNLSACAYNSETNTLSIRFNSGRTYNYEDVPATVYEGLMEASSPGSFFNSQIKDEYTEA